MNQYASFDSKIVPSVEVTPKIEVVTTLNIFITISHNQLQFFDLCSYTTQRISNNFSYKLYNCDCPKSHVAI